MTIRCFRGKTARFLRAAVDRGKGPKTAALVYQNLPEAEFKATLLGAGLPDGFAGLLACRQHDFSGPLPALDALHNIPSE